MAKREWQRLKFLSVELENIGSETVRTTVELRARASRSVNGTAECPATKGAELRCAALATVDAVCNGVGTSKSDMQFLGVRSVKAFDATVVIVALAVRFEDGMRRLVGAYLAESDQVRGAAIAVLNATNRYLGTTVFNG